MKQLYSQKHYGVQLGNCDCTISGFGCFLVSLSMLAEIHPITANELLKKGGYVRGCLINSSKSAEILGLEYDGKINKDPQRLCIAETDHYKSKGISQHFFIFNNGRIVDPLDQKPKWKKNKYKIVSYRLFYKKDTMKAYYVTSKLRTAIETITGKDRKKLNSKELQEKCAKDLNKSTEKWEELELVYHKIVTTSKKEREQLEKYEIEFNEMTILFNKTSEQLGKAHKSIEAYRVKQQELGSDIKGLKEGLNIKNETIDGLYDKVADLEKENDLMIKQMSVGQAIKVLVKVIKSSWHEK